MIDWDNYWIIKREVEFFKSGQKISAKLFMSVGALEDTNIVKGIQQIADVIKSRNYPGLQLKEQVFEDETHLSVSPAALSRRLRYIYSLIPEIGRLVFKSPASYSAMFINNSSYEESGKANPQDGITNPHIIKSLL